MFTDISRYIHDIFPIDNLEFEKYTTDIIMSNKTSVNES